MFAMPSREKWRAGLAFYGKLNRTEQKARREAEREALRAAGYAKDEWYFPMTKEGEAEARAFAATVEAATGVKLMVGQAII